MRLRTTVVAILMLVLIAGWMRPALAVPPSLLTNYGAEAGDLTGWTPDVTDEPWTVSSTDPQEGTKSFLSGNSTSTLTQTVDLLGLGYTESQLDSITELALSVYVKGNDDEGEDDTYDVGLQMLGAGFGAMAITSLPDPHVAPADWTQRLLGLGSYGAGMRHARVYAVTTDGAGTSGNHGASFDNFILTIADNSNPTLVSTSPADGATGVTVRSELTLEFSENVTVGTGDIVVHRASNDEVMATINVTSGDVAGSGTDTISVTLPASLPKSTEYYVMIDAGAFEDPWENAYAGIASSTAWNFRTVSSDTSVPAPRTFDYTVADAQAQVDETGLTRITWYAGADVPYVRIFTAVNGGTWERISDFVSAGAREWIWQIPVEDRGKELAFLVESTDLALRLDTAETAAVVWPDEIGSSPEESLEQNASAFAAGSYLRTASTDTVYRVDPRGARRPIPDTQTFFTWESSFDVVQFVSDKELISLSLGSPLPPKQGTVLVKVQSVPNVYAIDGTPEEPVLRWISSETLARDLYGDDWDDYIIDVPPTMWGHLAFGEDIEAAGDISIDFKTMLRREELR